MRQLGLFAKYWQPGEVKTRLAASLGCERASELHLAFLTASLARLSEVPCRRVLAFSPAEREAEFARLADSAWQLEPQATGDLGQRMACYFGRASAAGSRVVLVGSDAPSVPLEYIEQAFDVLDRQAVVLGPAADGGYYLVGLAGESPPIFSDVSWGTSHVWSETVDRLATVGSQPYILPPWYDVDTLEDLLRLRAELAELDEGIDPLAELKRAVEAALAGHRRPATRYNELL